MLNKAVPPSQVSLYLKQTTLGTQWTPLQVNSVYQAHWCPSVTDTALYHFHFSALMTEQKNGMNDADVNLIAAYKYVNM